MIMQEFALRVVKIHNKNISEYIDTSDCLVYHYTSPAGFNGIISNHTLRFTDRNYLNDYTEGRYVMGLCLRSRCSLLLPKEHRKFFKDKCEELYKNPAVKKRLVYQCSFSISSDNLALWNYYTKGEGIKGYNLCFSACDLESALKTNKPNSHKKTKVTRGKVIYNIQEQTAIIKKIISEFAEALIQEKADVTNCEIAIELLVEKLLLVGAFFKAPCFKHEEEYRMIIQPLAAWNDETNSVYFLNLEKTAATYEKNGLLIPYVDIEFSQNALKGITSSPTLDFAEVQANLRNVLRIYGYAEKTIAIRPSQIPIRY